MAQDRYGLEVTDGAADTLQGIDDFIHGFISYQPKAANIIATAQATPDHPLANAYAGLLFMFLEHPVAAEKAAPFITRAQAAGGTERERLITEAAALWAAGDIPGLVALCDDILARWPRDMVALKLAQYHHFNAGDFAAMLRVALNVAAAAQDIPYLHSMVAFGYEECHLLDKAEAAARRAMDLDESDPWAHHALAHVMLTRGQVDDGIALLEAVSDHWQQLNSFMRSHNWWHLALFYLSRGRHDDVRRAYDTQIWGLEKSYSQDQVGACSLLARMEFAGVDVGDRWSDLAAHIAARGEDTVNPFLTLQYLYALARTHNPASESLLNAIEARAEDDSRFDHAIWRDVALWAAHGIAAHAAEDWNDAIRFLGKALPRMAECGGSHAQRDLFDQIYLDALIRAGKFDAAQQQLELRRSFDPDGVPLNLLLARVYDKTGLPDLAAEARARTT